MTLPASGPLVLGSAGGGNSINSEFGYGNDLASYFGVYYGKGGSEYRFPLYGDPNGMQMFYFYGTYKVTGGSASYGSSQYATVPVYNTITISVTGAGGGGTGQAGVYQSPCSPAGQVTPGVSGNAGGSSDYGGYVAASGGGSDTGGSTVTRSYTNPVQGGSGPPSGSNVYVTIGTGGSGGAGGCFVYQNKGYNPFYNSWVDYGCSCWSRFNTGYTGANGSVSINWS